MNEDDSLSGRWREDGPMSLSLDWKRTAGHSCKDKEQKQWLHHLD